MPQNRERVFLVAINEKYGDNKFIYPEKTHGEGRKYPYITVGEAFKYLPSLNSGGGEEIQQIHYYYEEEYKNNKISEGFYEYIKFISGKEGYIPEHINHDECVNEIANHKAVNHREK